MNIFDFADQEQIDELPEDPHYALVQFVRIAQDNLAKHVDAIEQIDAIDQSGSVGWDQVNEVRHDFMNVVLGVARRLGVEPFLSMELPTIKSASYEDHRQFKSDLDHYMTQIVIDSSFRNKSDSTELFEETRSKLRSYLHKIKECIDNSDIEEPRKSKLLGKIADFEKILEKRRLSFLEASRLSIEIMMIPGALWATAQIPVQKLISNMWQTIAEAKVVDDKNRQFPPHEPPKALIAPREEKPEPISTGGAFDSDLDDDVPF